MGKSKFNWLVVGQSKDYGLGHHCNNLLYNSLSLSIFQANQWQEKNVGTIKVNFYFCFYCWCSSACQGNLWIGSFSLSTLSKSEKSSSALLCRIPIWWFFYEPERNTRVKLLKLKGNAIEIFAFSANGAETTLAEMISYRYRKNGNLQQYFTSC